MTSEQIIQETKDKESKELIQEIKDHFEKDKKWDVSKEEPIKFFDRNLSYELTGYRPINEKEGLDFNPDWFTQARDTYNRTGHYCQYPRNSKAYADFWTEEYKRCRDGYTVNGYTITGDHYFFLNYYQLMNTQTSKAAEGRAMDFPKFLVPQYEYLHYLELVKRTRKNAALMKARGLGFSEMNAAIVANLYSVRRQSMSIIAANDAKKLTPTLEKVWQELSFLNDNTDGGFFKLRQVLDKSTNKRASHYKMLNGQKVEDGWRSEILGIIADKPNKIRGYRTDLLIFEEGGSWPDSKRAFIQGQALLGVMGNQFGVGIIGGTGGDAGKGLEGLRDIYYNPESYNILPYRHNFTDTGEWVMTGYFLPAFCMNLRGILDKRGFTDPVASRKEEEKIRSTYAADPKGLLTYQAERCFTAEEAFALEGDNKFNKAILSEQLANIRLLKIQPEIETGFLSYTYKNDNHTAENITGFRWHPHKGGHIHILEHPLWTLEGKRDEEGKVIEKVPEMYNLYVAGVDGIDIGKRDTSEFTKDPSDFCMIIKKRVLGMSEPQYVAYYKDRPDNIREAYENAIRLARYYNCRINIEATRMSFLVWCRNNNLLSYFMKRPRATLSDIQKGKSHQYGTPATLAVINHQTDLIADFINDYGHTIWFEPLLDELIRYSDENKTKFDMVAAMAMAELADEELTGFVPKKVEVEIEQFEDIGYYYDEKGYKHYGIIPKTQPMQTRATDNFKEFESLSRSSRPPYEYYGSR